MFRPLRGSRADGWVSSCRLRSACAAVVAAGVAWSAVATLASGCVRTQLLGFDRPTDAATDGSLAPDAADDAASDAVAVAALATGLGYHACALLTNGSIKCWGFNDYGQLGLGDTRSRGDDPDEMGANLPPVDLGSGRHAKAIALGVRHTCAILDDDRVKCWGMNAHGRLGLADLEARGDAPGEMGDALPYVDLGDGRTAVAVAAGQAHTCALLDDRSASPPRSWREIQWQQH